MKLNVEFHADLKEIKKALIMLDQDLPTDQEIISRFENAKTFNFFEKIPDPERFQMIMAVIATIITTEPENKLPKSKFQTRLEEAQRIQEEKSKNTES